MKNKKTLQESDMGKTEQKVKEHLEELQEEELELDALGIPIAPESQ